MLSQDQRQEHRQIVRSAVPISKIGIYFLIAKRKIVYVGQSHNIPGRVAEHMVSKEFDSFAFVPADPPDLNAMERSYIDKFLPILNRDPMTEKLRRQTFASKRKGV